MAAEAVLEEVKAFGLEVQEDEEAAVAEKLVELCMLHRLKETDVADELVAFAAGKKIFLLTADFLNIFEHEALNKRSAKSHKRKENCYSGVRDINTIQELLDVEEEEENLLDAYAITPSKSSQKRAITTPENPRSKRTLSTRSPHLVFSPNSFSPSATPSQKYSSRGNRGEVVTSFGSAQGTVWSGNGGMSTSAKLFGPAEDSLTKRYKFMFQKLLDNREVLSYKIEELGEALKEHYQIEEFSSLNVPAQEPVAVLGQIGCDSNGKLNARSVILEGDREHSSGGQIPVDVSELVEYSLFPGQVVVMEGTNSTGGQLVASKLYEGVPLPFHKPTSPTEEPEQQMVLVACGPYTTSDSMTYDPIVDLIEVINKSRPDICILLGPFVDAKHTQVENYQLTASFEDVFKVCMKSIIDNTKSAGSRLVIVPSLRDVHHDCIYPQPPFSCYELSKEDKQRVLFVSDPCTLEINGVVFGLTSTDLLFHMGAEEISSSSSILDRFSRILKHVLTQRSYYPLYPPVEEINIDYENFYHHAHLPVTPDVLITPSDLRYFIKDILGCICMNPGRLTKGQVGGTYGRLYVRQQVSRDERKSPCIAAQVVRI
ncbi:DNA polymerase alpha subunit B isoform X1 [Eublepharis macularius]|uniref:DNA polymerase alpha subunit B n=1 Tax=Eublepharis macularius TaxID=481883 RepID=A0AA97L0R0_EUBMA|nr:DNA polymerase alpha subunit B isoform X1 [Eublepharis macularius]